MKQYLLMALVAVQIVVVLAIWLFGLQGPKDPEPFIQFEIDTVDGLTVSSSEESISLTLEDEQWRLPDGNPADTRKVERVLDRLSQTAVDWPVATSESTAKRFEVTKDSFQKQISVLAGNDAVADVYLGTSPSFRKIHARSVDGGPVYSIEFASHEAGTTLNSWLDKSLLRPEGSISSLERVDAFVLTKDEGVWSVVDGTELDQSEVRDYVERFEDLSVFELSEADLSETDPSGRVVIRDDEGSYTLTVFYVEESEDWVVHSDREVGHYGLASYIGSEILKDLEDLLPNEENEEDGEQSFEDGEAVITVEDITEEE
ncbi:MAG: DUF4340 domain-containing protein [Gammaproteobacteria bacterium]|nr:DUF4340 domain-containing protein [Gammaproteobacteria bacterium]